MSWRCYRLQYRAESPIQIGWHRLGFVIRTRGYVPARNIWGCWVAGWARTYGNGWSGGDNPYQAADQELGKWLRFTPMYAMENGNWLRPKFDRANGKLCYGPLKQAQFESLYIHSVASTSIGPTSLSAADGMLHEKECFFRRGMQLGMYVLVRQDGDAARLWAILAGFALGGGIGYGFGRMRLTGEPKEDRTALFDEFELQESEHCVLSGGPGSAIASFVSEESGPPLDGEAELLSGREWWHQGSGQRVREARAYWAPGSLLRDPRLLTIDQQGFWQ
jgi:hypothetical protein